MSKATTAADWRAVAMRHHRAGEMARAAEAWGRAAAGDPRHPETRNNLGVALQALGRLDDADAAFAEAARLKPEYADAWENRVGVLLALGRAEDAIATAREMVRRLGPSPAAHVVLATALASAGRFDEARAAASAGLAREPRHLGLLTLLARIETAGERWAEAAAAWASVAALTPDDLDARVNIGVCQRGAGQLDQAIGTFREVLTRDGSRADAELRLADALDAVGDLSGALAAAQRAARLLPNDPAALNLLAALSERAGNKADVEPNYRRALAADPNHAPSLANYATVLARRGEIEQAIPMLRRAVEIDPDAPVAHSTLCMYLNAAPGVDPREVAGEHRRWAGRFAESQISNLKFESQISNLKLHSARRLRIGYVSPDWAGHPVARFMQPILEAHDRDAFEVHVYDDAPRSDAFTELLKPLAHAWHRVRGMPDGKLAQKIREDQIDILVDLAGHTANNRLRMFGMRAAPVQFSYCGYPNTTGLPEIDYRLTDAIADPPGLADELHTERLVRLPRVFLAFRPPVQTPAVSESPALRNGYVTFGSFNALWKMNAPLLRLWARVLAAVSGSRLLMKADGLEDPAVARRIASVFEASGIASDRLRLVGREKTYAAHLDAYGSCDVCLDTFPYAGTTTTCEALWMGVPVVSRVGEVHAARVGASLLSSVGLPELAASTDDTFIDTAARLAGDVSHVASLRRGMRKRVSASPLCDAIGLTRAIETAFQASLAHLPR